MNTVRGDHTGVSRSPTSEACAGLPLRWMHERNRFSSPINIYVVQDNQVKRIDVTTELTNSGIGMSEVRSLPSLDITGLAVSPLTFPGGLA